MTNPLLWTSLAASLLYYVTQPWQPFPGSIALKGLSVAPLAVWVFRSQLPRSNRWLLGLALAFGSLGDVLLDWSVSLFSAGLGSFLVGHLLYIVLFWTNRPKPAHLSLAEKAIILGLGLFATFMSVWLLPATGDMGSAVALYMGALTGMVLSAVVLQLPERWVVVGALLFLLSDTILAVGKFKGPVPGRNLLVWPTYYVGQLLIAAGCLRASSAFRGKT